jgi:transmembrane sensor
MDEERLARYLAGDASDADRSQVDAWAAADPSRAAELSRLQVAWRPTEPAGTWDVTSAWTKVSSRLDSARFEPEIIPVWRRPFVQWLAAAGLLVAVGTGAWLTVRDRPTVYQTAVGERREITLEDGSRITMAPASRIEIAAGYGQPYRAVTLAGRAWFEVDHDEARPFRVQVGQTQVEDLGTEFEVDASSADVVVSVMSGSVSVRAGAAAAVTLGPKDVAKVTPSGQPQVDHQVAVERFLAWRKGTLSFENRPIGQVLDELERWHEVDFVASDEIRGRSFTGDLPTDRLDVAMATLTTAMTLTANQLGKTVTLTYKAAP